MAKVERWQQVGIPLLMALLAFAPLFRASNRPLPLLVLELGAMALLALVLWQPGRLNRIPIALVLLGCALLLLPLLQLTPLPVGVADSLPGREPYAAVFELLAREEQRSGWIAISLIPTYTEAALYQTLPIVAVFAATYLSPVEQVKRLVSVLLAVAGLQAALGLMQYGAGAQSVLYFGNPYASHRIATGTYANRDHLAGLMEMVFPVAMALFVATLGRGGSRRRRGRWRRRLEFMTTLRGHQAAVYGALAVLLLLALVFTRSRAGVALAMLGLFMTLLAFARRLGGGNVYGTLGTVMAVALVLAAEVGLTPVLDRFSQDPLADARWSIFATSIDGIGGFFPVGSGAGSYPYLYPLFQPVELGRSFVNHAHNDFIEAVFEGGLPALLLIVFGLALYFRQWPRVWSSGRWGEFRFVQVGAGIGLTLMLLHSLVDFNMQIPANAVFAAFLLAVFMKDYRESPRRRRGHRPTPTLAAEGEGKAGESGEPGMPAEGSGTSATRPGPVEEDENPFLKTE